MSLVVCSNIREDISYDRDSNYEAAYNFHNALKQTMKIEPDSEVAVQSVKINKSSTITLNQSSLWYEYFGKDLNTTQTKSDAGPYREIQCNPILDAGAKQQSVTTEDFSSIIASSMNVGMPHPDIYGEIKCAVVRDGSTNAFLGFKVSTDYKADAGTNLATTANLNAVAQWEICHTAEVGNEGVEVTTDAAGPIISRIAGKDVDSREGCVMSKCNFPLSHLNGKCEWDVSGMRTGGLTGYGGQTWQVGLARSILRDDTFTNPQASMDCPEYYDLGASTGFGGSFALEANFFDIVVSCEAAEGSPSKRLKVHQATSTGTGICLTEVLYFGYAGAAHADRINLSATGGTGVNLKTIVFELSNEIMNISFTNDAGTSTSICSFTADTAAGAKKENLILPMGQTRWNLHPKATYVGNTAGSSMQLIHFDGHESTFRSPTIRKSDNNYYCRLERRGEIEELRGLDTRPFQDMSIGPTDAPTYIPEGAAADGGGTLLLTNRQTQFILSPALKLFVHSQNANFANILGFERSPLLAPSTNGKVDATKTSLVVYQSDSDPDVASTASLFVRLDNFTQTSFNAGVGRPSKILYHLPRFDTSNRDLGAGLYFEPTERTYVKLGNSDTLYQNSIDISIANDNEVLATDLVGKTIVVLHFRKSANIVTIDK